MHFFCFKESSRLRVGAKRKPTRNQTFSECQHLDIDLSDISLGP